jgi:autotransporter-associated beta strand protein
MKAFARARSRGTVVSLGRPSQSFVAVLVWLVLSLPVEAAFLVHTWRGDANNLWGRTENWGNGVPEPGSVLWFPQNANYKTNANDLQDFEAGSIVITGNAYRLGGFACSVNGGLSSTNATTNQISLTLRTAGPIYLTHPQGRLLFSGVLTLRTFSTEPVVRNLYSGGYLELRGQVEARERVVSPSGSAVWSSRTAILSVHGPGAVEMSGPNANTHGPTVVENGTLYLNKSGASAIPDTLTISDHANVVVAQPNQIDDAADVTISSLGRLTVQADEAIARLEGDGDVSLAGGNLTVGKANRSFAFAGHISGSGGLIKAGSGIMTLGQSQSYAGPTVLAGGTLLVNGDLGWSPFYLASGTLSGGGRLGNTSVTNGVLAPGLDDRSEKLHLQTLSLGPSARLSWRQDANGWSGLTVDETVTLSVPELEIRANYFFAPSNGQVITLIDNRGAEPVHGAFAGRPVKGNLLVTDDAFRAYVLRYDGGDGNDVTLTLTNPPLHLLGSQSCRVVGGNGNATLDPNECVHLTCTIFSAANATIEGLFADLQCDAEGVFILQPHARFENLIPGSAGGSLPGFEISTSPGLPCATNVAFRLVVRSASHGAVTIPFSLETGCTPGTGPCEGCLATRRATFFPLGREPTHPGVLIPSGDGDACAGTNACPAFLNPPGVFRRYHLYAFTNAFVSPVDNCYMLYLTSLSSERLMATVYRDSFDPNALCSPNFLVCTPGLARQSTEQCRFRWSYGVIQVVVTEFDGPGAAAPYELRIAGAICPPELEIESLPNRRFRLSWPTASPSYELEAFPDLGGLPEPLGLPTHVWNGRFVITNGVEGNAARFFRLAFPQP